MHRPQSQHEQYMGKVRAEFCRGSGRWPKQEMPCPLEPPWDEFDWNTVNPWDCVVNDWDGGYVRPGIFSSRGPTVHPLGEPLLLLLDDRMLTTEDLAVIHVEQFPEDDTTIPKAEQLLRAIQSLPNPVAFELIGCGAMPKYDREKTSAIIKGRKDSRPLDFSSAVTSWTAPATTTQFTVRKADLELVARQLSTCYPNSAIVSRPDDPAEFEFTVDLSNRDSGYGAVLCLESPYFFPLRTFTHLDPDPLAVAVSAMEDLGPSDWALLQVLFAPAKYPWAETIECAIENPFKRDDYNIAREDVRQVRAKFQSPLFAVSIRIAGSRPDVVQHLKGWSEQFTNAPHQRLDFDRNGWTEDGPTLGECISLESAIINRCVYQPGLLLNIQELASLIHLPTASIPSERLKRITARTRPVAATADERGSVVLGVNTHRGESRVARIPASLRPRHCYVAGASGTGKSTLLLNMILQDISAGEGVGVLDPHGDLIQEILQRIPAHRIDDIVLFDPADEHFPFPLNILEAQDEDEEERIVNETVMALERYFPSSWGPRLERILRFTIHTALHAIDGATLADVERMLIDPAFRDDVISRTRNPLYLQYWRNEFKHLPKNAVDPVLNKLSVFLLSRTVRNIVCQRHSAIDFDHVINSGKIILANLSTGMLTEKIAGTLGSFLVTKIVNAAFRRARIPEARRRPWHLYVDEFQAFMNLSVGFERILAEARKYKLVLAGLANQYVGQLSPQVRQAIFGNIGVMVVFRLGVDDAVAAAKEMGIFTVDEILNLEMGEAIARAGGSKTSFNLRTYPPPDTPTHDPSAHIVALTRERYARPREEVEQELAARHKPVVTRPIVPKEPTVKASRRKAAKPKSPTPQSPSVTPPAKSGEPEPKLAAEPKMNKPDPTPTLPPAPEPTVGTKKKRRRRRRKKPSQPSASPPESQPNETTEPPTSEPTDPSEDDLVS